MHFVSRSVMSLLRFKLFLNFGGQIFLFFYFLEVQTLAGPFCFHSKINPGTALSKIDPTWNNLGNDSVVCCQMPALNVVIPMCFITQIITKFQSNTTHNTNYAFQRHVSTHKSHYQAVFNPLNAELNPICHLLALLGAHLIFHVSSIRVKPYFSCTKYK
jgi:hypothetical protein